LPLRSHAQSAIACAVLHGLAATAAQAQSATEGGALPTIVVTAPKAGYAASDSAAAGALGARAILDTPFTVNVVTRQLIDDQQARLLTEVLRTDPAATTSFGGGYTSYQSVNLRGFGLSNTANFRRDGLPFTHLSETPFENVERVEVLKGLSGFLYGFASPGGIVNLVPKKPTNSPTRSVRLGYTSNALAAASVDLGGRLGADNRFGYRVNVAAEQGETAIDGAHLSRRFGSAYLDWRVTPGLVLALDLETHRIRPRGQPLYYQLAAGVPVPAAPDLSRLNGVSYSGYETRDDIIGLRADWVVAPGWTLALAAQDHDHRRDAWFPSATILNSAGDLRVNLSRDALQAYPNRSALAVLSGQVTTGPVRHELAFGVNWNSNENLRGDYIDAPSYSSNLYSPVPAPASSLYALRAQYRAGTTHERGSFVADTLHLGERWQVLAGLRRAELSTRNYNFSGAQTAAYDRGATTPSVAVVFKPSPGLAWYGSFVKGLEQGGRAPAGTVNAGEVFAPLESQQVEAGLKWQPRQSLLMTASLFRIDKGLGFTDPATNRFTQEGSQVHDGLEASVTGELGPALSVSAGYMLLDAVAKRTGNPAVEGRRPVNVPRHTATLLADWRVPALKGLAASVGWQYVGQRALDATNARFIPGYSLVNLGLRYDSAWLGRGTTLRAHVDNLFDKAHWAAATPTLYAGLPRTVKLSVQVDL
jgi:iron complex outermembrane receptor protein